ncbi:MAG: hypothetical protein ABL873_09045 [Gallionella sp.]
MLRLTRTLNAKDSADLAAIFKQELAQQGRDYLPLQQALRHGSSVLDTPLTVLMHDARTDAQQLRIRAGIFYQSVTAGCSCADDPTPLNEHTEYCEVQVFIDTRDARASVMLVED